MQNEPVFRAPTARDRRNAAALAEMASGDEISYCVNDLRVVKFSPSRVWYEVVATHVDGRTWKYWLARDYGSYRGSFLNGLV